MSRNYWKSADEAPPLDQPEHRKPRDIFGGGSQPSGTTSTNTIQQSDPWSGVQPYLQNVFGQGQSLYNRGPYSGPYIGSQSPYTQQATAALAQRGATGSPLVSAAQNELQNTINGQYLDPNNNPAFKSAVGDALGLAGSTFAGQYGGAAGSNLSNSGYQEGLTRTLGQLATNAYSQQYNTNRQQQLQATQLAPTLAAQDYTDIGAIGQAGATQDARSQAEAMAQQQQYNAPWANLQQYAQSLSGGQGYGSTSGSSSQPYFTNPMANALGMGIGAAGLYNMGTSGAGGGLFGALGGLFGGGSTGAYALGGMDNIGAAMAFSDVRLKENIERVGTHDETGIGIYKYNYKGDARPQVGVLAQELEQVKPEAVTEVAGFKAVNYKMI